VYAGVGVTSSTPKEKLDGTYYSLNGVGLEGKKFSPFQPVIPIGIGLKIKVTTEADILIDYGYRITFTDYLDGIGSGRYDAIAYDQTSIASRLNDRRYEVDPRYSDQAFRDTRMKTRGSSKLDAYSFFSVKYQYTFSKSQFKRFRRGFSGSFKSRLNRYR
jgi:hypothetical protein